MSLSLKRIFRRSFLVIALTSVFLVGSVVAAHVVSVPTLARAAAVVGSIQDPNIKYIGRWDTTSSTTMYKSYWNATYFKTSFTGKTVKLKLAAAVNIYVAIDGGADVLYSSSGTVNLTPTPLAAGTHTLRVAVRSGYIEFEGLVLDPGAVTVAPKVSTKLIEFVGDSITSGGTDTKKALSGYGWLIGEQLHVEHTQISQPGITLVPLSTAIGMSTQYFKLGTIYDANTPNWDFSHYQATAVVINLGTNDNGAGVAKSTFQSTYTTFIRNVRAKYPHAAIFAFETLRQVYVPETQAVVTSFNAAGDKNVYFVNTTGWLTTADYTPGGGHPNDQGQMKIAAKLAPIISKVIGS